jgi:hypothetical protein
MKVKKFGLVVAALCVVTMSSALPVFGGAIPLGGATWQTVPPSGLGPSSDGNPPGTILNIINSSFPEFDEFLISPSGGWGAFAFEGGVYDVAFLLEITARDRLNEVFWTPLLDLNDQTTLFSGPDSPVTTAEVATSNLWALGFEGKDNFKYWSSTSDGNWGIARSSSDPGKNLVFAEDLNCGLHLNCDNDLNDFVGSVQVAPVPEPGTMLLFGSALLGLAALRRRKQQV